MKIPWLKFEGKYQWIALGILTIGALISAITGSAYPLFIALFSPLIFLLLLPVKFKLEDRLEEKQNQDKLHQSNLNLQKITNDNFKKLHTDTNTNLSYKKSKIYSIKTDKGLFITTKYYRNSNFVFIIDTDNTKSENLKELAKELKSKIHSELRNNYIENFKPKKLNSFTTPLFLSIGSEKNGVSVIYREDAGYYNFDIIKKLINEYYTNPEFKFSKYDNIDISNKKRFEPKPIKTEPKRDFLKEAREKFEKEKNLKN